ncbi:retrovirus-related pol polyprotein from transposon TNT 1-94 [Tanacetum coccineum]
MNKDKKFRFAKSITSSSNIPKHTDSLKTKDFNKPLLTFTGVKPTTSASGSKPSGNTKNNRITRPPSSNQKNKVQENLRKVKSSLNKMNYVSEPNSNALVKHYVRNVKFDSIYAILAFCKHNCFIRDLNGVDLLKGSRGSNLYTLSMDNLLLSSPICLLSKASKTKSWLWHRRLSHLNFDYITSHAKPGLVRGLPKLKYQKDHLFSACALGKSKKHSHKPKAEDTIQEKRYLLHMDLCGPMRIQSINGRKYILVIVDDYSQFTWVKYLRSKDEVLEFVTKFLKMIQVRLNVTIRNIRTDNGTKFVKQTLKAYYEEFEISHHTSVACTPQQNGVVKRRNHTLVVAAHTMLMFLKAPLFLWAEAVATACYMAPLTGTCVKDSFVYCMRTRSQARSRNRRQQQLTTVIVEEPEFPMADNRTMAQMLQAPIEGYEDAIVVPTINANNFELKQTLINLVQSNQFTGKQDPHNHLRFFNKVTSTFRHPEVPNTTIKLLLFPFSLEGEARTWLDKEPPRSILTWDDLVSKFINQFFPPSKTTYLRNEIQPTFF